jgi:gliding motility associated protien GldN
LLLWAVPGVGQDTICPYWAKSKASIFDPAAFKNDSSEKKYAKVSEQQVMFSKKVWSYIDFKESNNRKLCNNSDPKNGIYPLYEILNLFIAKGKIFCFRTSDFGSSRNTPLTMAEFKRAGIRKDSIEERTIDEEGNDKVMKVLKADTLSSDKILGFVVKEDWFFNKRSVLMEKKLIGFAPVYYDAKLQRQKELYWVYFPEACEILSGYLTLNPKGGKDPFTYRDLLISRAYSSYVLKESNVYDRDKPENSRGFEVEYENKKNREKFESGEEDLWSK